ncbi:MAG: hypothetical protein ACKVOU_00725 [Cytophagales bacterium]
MNKKEILSIEVQMLAIACTMILGTGAGVGFILTNDLTIVMKIAVGIPVFFVFNLCCYWAINTYIRIKKFLKQ